MLEEISSFPHLPGVSMSWECGPHFSLVSSQKNLAELLSFNLQQTRCTATDPSQTWNSPGTPLQSGKLNIVSILFLFLVAYLKNQDLLGH